MSRLDIVIFGATGFTGKRAVEEIVRLSKQYPGLTWAIAGRSQSKLEELRLEVSKKTGEDLSSIKIIVADVNDEKSLKEMCEQTKVIANCCGPYRFYGEQVVRAAIQSKTHYVDVSGEPQFMETMQLNYDQQAREAGVYVIGACGFDSVPNDMGVVFLQQNFNGTLNSVESYLSASVAPEYQKEARSGFIHYATWESLVHSVAHAQELAPLRKKLFPEPLPPLKPKLQSRGLFHKNDGKPCIPFPGSDSSVVYRTQRRLHETGAGRPAQFKAYIKFESWLQAALTVLVALVVAVMTKTAATTRLLLSHPRLFSLGAVTRDGPTQGVMNNTSFTVEMTGVGWDVGADVDATEPTKKVAVKVVGKNPGYEGTVIPLLFSALTILKEQDKMPGTGGVMTTGAAFRNTQFIKHLNENSLKFEIVDNK